MTIREIFSRLLPIVALAGLVACGGTTELTNVWANSQFAGPLDNVLVIGLSKNQTTRRTFEDRFVKEFGKDGVRAVSSAEAIPGTGRIDSTAIHRYVIDNHIDAILVTRVLGVDKQQEVPSTPGRAGTVDSTATTMEAGACMPRRGT